MYRIRLHGRGGQGIKTAGRILGTALFMEGFEVQDAPRYGAERRGAPIFAYVRANSSAIYERGVIHRPDLVVVADETLLNLPAANVLEGLSGSAVLLINSARPAEHWCQRLQMPGPVTVADGDAISAANGRVPVGTVCAGAAARLLGVVSRSALAAAVDEELAGLDPAVRDHSRQGALAAFDLLAAEAGLVERLSPSLAEPATGGPDWVELSCEPLPQAAPTITAVATSRLVETGLWRTRRPEVDRQHCSRCGVCFAFCPEGGIDLDREGYPVIDYRHCKGCLICAAQCPQKAIRIGDETEADEHPPGGDS